MKNIGWYSRLLNHRLSAIGTRGGAGTMAAALLLAASGIAAAQQPTAAAPAPAPMGEITIPTGYASHQSVDVGGRMTGLVGSGAMYDTLVNLQSGPRVLGETFELHALPDHKNGAFDDLNAFGSGFGGDPNAIARINLSKAKIYEFTGLFRRDRLYSDYDLLGNPNIPAGMSVVNLSNNTPVPALGWSQVKQSALMFNTVRRMTDVSVTLVPFATFSYRFGYFHGTMEGPTLSPSYTLFGMKYNALLQQYERNGSDDYLGAVDWKLGTNTKISFEMTANHYKSDTSFSLAPNGFNVQESDGTPAYLGNFTSFVPYGIAACNTTSMGGGYTNASNYTILSPANKPGGLPVINGACDVVTSYTRSQPTRIWTPTETVRLQSAAIKNVSMNGNLHYTLANMNMPNYYESSVGLNGSTRSALSTGGYANAHRAVIGADYGIVWQVTPVVSIGEQVSYSSVHQPGYSLIPAPVTQNTLATAGNQTINNMGPMTAGTGSLPHGINGTLTSNFFGNEFLINNLTLAWDAAARARFSVTYRYSNRNIGQGASHQGPIPGGSLADPVSGTVSITENAGIFNAALRPTNKWDVNGTVEIGYADNAFTPVSPRQFQQYRVHTLYRANAWMTLNGSLSDRERHNNTNNNVGVAGVTYVGPLNHVDHSRIGSIGAVLAPNERYNLNFNYSYSDVYAATNICYSSGAAAATSTSPAIPGAAQVTAGGAPNLCAGGATWFARDFMDAPTQFGSVAVGYAPVEKVRTNIGYMVSAVNGSRFFNDARDVNGMLASTYQSPFVNLAWTLRPGLTWRAEYNFFGYGEGGASGSALCSMTTSATATISPCASLPYPTGMTEGPAGASMPRNFHANNVVLAIHYEF